MAVKQTSSRAAFIGLVGSDAEAVSELLASRPRIELVAGTRGVSDDFDDAALLVLEEGVVGLRAPIPERRRAVIVCLARAGAVLLPPAPDEVLRVLVDAVIVPLPTPLRDSLLAIPGAANIVVDTLASTLRQKTRTIANLSSFHHSDRLRSKLVQLAHDHGRVGRDGIRLDFPLTHDLLAEMIGSARETVTRAIDDLQSEGTIVRAGREYILRLPPEQLVQLRGE